MGSIARADSADLSVAMALDEDPPPVGKTVNYTVSVSNLGPGTTSANLTVTFDCGEIIQKVTTDASGNSAFGFTGQSAFAGFGPLGAGVTAHVFVAVKVQTRFAAGATATVSDNGSDPNLQNNSTVYKTHAPPPATAKLLNISTRGLVENSDNTLIAGFIVQNPCTQFNSKNLVVRVIGPSLTSAGVSQPVADPRLELHLSGSGLVASNDNWQLDSSAADLQSLGFAPKDDREAAIKRSYSSTQAPQFTAVAYPVSQSGIGVLEVYDLDTFEQTRLANISTRGFVGMDDNVLIGGFVLNGGNGTGVLLLRAIGPSLSGVINPLANPSIELRNAQGAVLGRNDDWKDSQESDIRGTSIPPTRDEEAALLVTLPSGSYTAIVRSSGEASGVGLVEVYSLQ